MMDHLLAILRAVRFNFTNETELQDGIEKVLTDAGLKFAREHRLGDKERIDFLITDGGIGIEVKIAGTPNNVQRQCLGYVQHDCIEQLLLITSRLRLSLPEQLNGKPARVLSLWTQAF